MAARAEAQVELAEAAARIDAFTEAAATANDPKQAEEYRATQAEVKTLHP